MALLSIPVWTIPPDWSGPVSEGLEWLTGVHVSQIGVEQRQKLRRSPRRYFSYDVAVDGVWRTYFDNLMSIEPMDLFYLPLWHEIGSLRLDASAADTTLQIVGAPGELSLSPVIFVPGDRPWHFEVLEVASISAAVNGDTIFHLTSPLEFDWPKNNKVHPCAPARLNQMPTYNRLSDSVVKCSLRFDLHQANDWAGTGTYDTYRDYPVIDIAPNEADSQGGSYFRYLAQIDNTVGLVFSKDIGGSDFGTTSFSTMVASRVKSDDFRTLMYAMCGRAGQAWFVQPTSDFVLAKPIPANATVIYVQRSGIADVGGPGAARQDICIRLRDGTKLYHRLTAAVVDATDTSHEKLTLDPEVPFAISKPHVARISLMRPGRLDQDLIEMVHQSDTEGVATTAFAVKSVPDLRTGGDWFPPPLPLSTAGGCGPSERMFWARRNNGPWNGDPTANPSFGFGGIPLSGSIAGDVYAVLWKNTGFIGDQHSTANFGGATFRQSVPFRVAAWGPTDHLDPDTKGSSVALSADHLSMWLDPETTGHGARSLLTSNTQFGLRYFEVVVTAKSQNDYIGFCNAACGMNGAGYTPDWAHGAVIAGGDSGDILVNGGGTGKSTGGPWADGDVISVIIYTAS